MLLEFEKLLEVKKQEYNRAELTATIKIANDPLMLITKNN